MKVLFNCYPPFMLAHGGMQVQTERTMAALQQVGVEVAPLEWWNDRQTCDILHQIGAVSAEDVELAQQQKWKVASTVLLTQTCNRPAHQLLLRKILIRSALSGPLPRGFKDRLPWRGYHACDRIIVGLEAERRVMRNVYGLPERKIALVPLGLTEAFLTAGPPARTTDHLICTGRIDAVKNSLKLAKLALQTNVPIQFVGKPHDTRSDYWREFQSLIDQKIVKHHPHVSEEAEMVELLRKSRGYVLISRYENWSLAAHEAAACGLPLLLPDQPWSRERFGAEANYWPRGGFASLAAGLREFYDRCPRLGPPKVKLYSWVEVAEMLKQVYEQMLRE